MSVLYFYKIWLNPVSSRQHYKNNIFCLKLNVVAIILDVLIRFFLFRYLIYTPMERDNVSNDFHNVRDYIHTYDIWSLN